MSNTKKFVALAAVAFAFAFAMTAFAATWDFGSTTLKLGSTGTSVSNLQTALNAENNAGLTVDGDFGHGTLAAVEAFQASKGLTADGLAGNMTKAALNGGSAVSTTCPAGFTCTSNGSTPAPVCPLGYTCVSNSGTPAGNQSGAPLSINQVSGNSGYSNTSVGIGQTDKQVADIRIVTGAGGAGTLTGLNVTITNVGTGDYQFTKYASAVDVWMGGVKVGSLPVSSFTNYNSGYSAFIPLTGAMLNASTTSDLYIAINALPTIDSANLGSTSLNNWAMSGVTLRYSDATGAAFQQALTSTGSIVGSGSTVTNAIPNSNFTFNTAAAANTIKLTVTKDNTDSSSHVVQGSTGTNTQNVTLATIDLNAQGSAITVNRIPVTVGIWDGASTANVQDVLNTLRLYDASGHQLDSETVASSTTACPVNSSLYGVSNTVCETVTFQNLNTTGNGANVSGVVVPVNTTSVFTIKADINTIGNGNFAAGSYAVAEFIPANTTAIQAYDPYNNLLPQNSMYLVGSTSGSKAYFYANSINVTGGGATGNYAAPGGGQTHGTVGLTIPFSVSAFGTTAYIPSTATAVAGTTGVAGSYIQFCTDTSAGTCQATGTGRIQYTGSNGLVADANGNFQIQSGQTQSFVLQITLTPAAAAAFRGLLTNVNWNTTDSASTYSTYTAGLSNTQFQTLYVVGS